LPDKLLVVAIVLGLIAAGSFAFVNYASPPASPPATSGKESSNHVVSADQIVSGGPPPDGIPSIDHPKFITAQNATFLSDDGDWVIGINYNGDVRAYPLEILVWHEIVNDVVGGVPVAITYCPLCYSTDAFIRVLNGTTVQFGTSGRLYNNNLVMYDRLTKSLWSQAWGEAISGNLTGHKLQRVPIDVVTWGEWKKLYPSTLVLSRQTGFARDYSDDPYGAYYYTNEILFPLSHLDKRLPPKTVVLGLTFGDESKAYVLGNLTALAGPRNPTPLLLTDTIKGNQVLLWKIGDALRFFNPVVSGVHLTFTNANGTIVDSETHSSWNFDGVAIAGPLKGNSMTRYVSETAFWFAWGAFYPNTSIYATQ